jgi:ketol-acid reductoisomerase
MTIIYYEDAAHPEALEGVLVGVFGYAELGRALTLNMMNRGVKVLVYAEDEYHALADADGVPQATADEVARHATVLLLTAADETLADLYIAHIAPHLTRGKALLFTSGYTVASGFIEPPPFVDVGLIAPRVSGEIVRAAALDGAGVVSFVAVAQDASTQAWEIVLAVAHGAGLLRGGAFEISFEQEPQLALFVKQVIQPVFYQMMVTAARVLIESGYLPEAALTDLYLNGTFSDFFARAQRDGMLNALKRESQTAQYAFHSRLDRFKELKLERLMEVTLNEIRSGAFSKEWSREYAAGQPRFSRLSKSQDSLELWDWEQQTLDDLNAES